MPMTLSRSLITVLIPGLIFIAPWLLILVQHTRATLGFSEYNTLATALVFASAAVAGMIIEGLGTRLEVMWDDELEEDLAVTENWYAYLARKVAPEPVAYRYLSRLVTTLYTELALVFAVPSFCVGGGILAALRFPELACPLSATGVVLAILAVWYFFRQAKDTHKVICRTRKEVNARLGG